MAQAYSYIRFSSKRQEHGDSLRRQTALRDAYLAQHPELTLNTQNYEDLGVSAYRGKNATEGKLKMFLDAVQSGAVKRGSHLLIESLDRLSRAQVMDALELFLSITKSGITIVTLVDGKQYSRASIQANWTELIITIAQMARATEESETKSHRIRMRWANKREVAKAEGKVMTSRAPAWLTLSSDRTKWIVGRKKAKTVERVYDLALAGSGCPSITRLLNEKQVPTLTGSDRWNVNSVLWLLRSHAVIGTWTSKTLKHPPIPDYYPAIISTEKFAAVQDTLVKRRWIGGRSSAAPTNLFSGMCFCGDCNNRMKIISSSHPESSGRPRRPYFRCLSAYESSGCDQPKFPYQAAERAILARMGGYLSKLAASVEEKQQPVRDVETERAELKRRLDNLYDLYSDQRTDSLREKIAALEEDLRQLDGEASKVVLPAEEGDNLRAAAKLFKRLESRDTLGDDEIEERELVRTTLKRVVSGIYFLVEGKRYSVAVTFYANDQHTEYINLKDADLPKMYMPRGTGKAPKTTTRS